MPRNSAFSFQRKHPHLGSKFVRAKWLNERIGPRLERFLETKSVKDLVLLAVWHPVFTVAHVFPNMHISWSRKADASPPLRGEETTRDIAADSPVTETAETGHAHKGEVGMSASGETNNSDENLEPDALDGEYLLGILADTERQYLDRQVVSAAIRMQDARLFGGEDWDEDGFVRLMLRESYHDFVLPGSEERHQVVFEPRLLLHRSAVAQLDLAICVEGSLDTRQVLSMMWSPEPRIVRSRMSVPLLRGTRWEGAADHIEDELDAGQQLAVFEHRSPVSLTDLLHIHMEAILSVIRRSNRHWTIFPTSIIEVDDCCGSPEEWRRVHREDLIRLTGRGAFDRQLGEHVEPPTDLSMGRDHSLYATLGSATYLEWDGSPPHGIAELDTVLVIEYALLVYERLRALEEAVSRLTLKEQDLRRRYRDAVSVFSDMRQRNLRSGESREIVRRLLTDLGASEMRRTIETALDMAGTAYATHSAERSARRSWWITLAATIVAFFVAIPPIQEILNTIPTRAHDENWTLTALRWFSELGFWGPWLFVAAICLVLCTLWLLVATRWRPLPRHLPSFRRGYRWPTEFKASEEEWSPASGGPSDTRLSADVGPRLRAEQTDDEE